jgi:hypothetical protein
MTTKIIYVGPKRREVSISEAVLKKLGIAEKTHVSNFQIDRIQEELFRIGKEAGVREPEKSS